MKQKPKAREKAATANSTINNRAKIYKRLYILGLIVISAIYLKCYTTVFDYKLDMGGDNIQYYSLGNALADGKGYSSIIGFTETPHNHFPPGYPFLISLALRAGCSSIVGIKILNGILLFLSCIILYVLFYRITKNVYITFIVTLMMATNNDLLRSATIMMSEIPFLFFSSLVLLLFYFLVSCKKSNARYWLLLCGVALLTVFSYFIRSVGIALWLALLCTLIYMIVRNLWTNRKTEGWKQHLAGNRLLLIAFAVIVALFMLGKTSWDMRNNYHGLSSSGYVSQLTVQLGGTRITDMKGWIDRLEKNTVRYLTKEIPHGMCMKPVEYNQPSSGKDWAIGIAMLLVIIAGLFSLSKNDGLLFFYVGGTAIILLLWPDIWYSTRFMLPIVPLLMLLFAMGTVKITTFTSRRLKIKNPAILSATAAVIILYVLYPNYNNAIQTAGKAAKFKEYTAANTTPPLVEYIDAMRWVKNNLPDTARISTRKPELFYIYSGGRKSSSFPYYGTPEEVMDYLSQNKIQYVIIDHWFRHAYTTVVPAVQKYQDKFRVAVQIGGKTKDVPPTYVLEYLP